MLPIESIERGAQFLIVKKSFVIQFQLSTLGYLGYHDEFAKFTHPTIIFSSSHLTAPSTGFNLCQRKPRKLSKCKPRNQDFKVGATY